MDKPKQTIFYSGNTMCFERDGKVMMRLELKSASDQKLIEARWVEGAGMGVIAQALEAMGYKV